jgi:hypothetical protein
MPFGIAVYDDGRLQHLDNTGERKLFPIVMTATQWLSAAGIKTVASCLALQESE